MKKFLLIATAVLMSALAGCASASASSAPINVISREDGSGTRGAFIELFGVEVRDGDTRRDMTTVEASIVNRTDVMLTTVAGDRNAIGYVSISSLNDTVKALPIDGVSATTANIQSGAYGISRPFIIAVKDEPQGLTRDFINFILSAEGQEVVLASAVPVTGNAPAFTGASPDGSLVVAGSSSVAPLMEKLIEAYRAINTNAHIEMQTTDSTAGMNAVIDGICDIGMSSRDLRDSEKEQLIFQTIAIDGIAVIASGDNPVEGLTKEEVRRIFTGEITNWGEIQ